jgi:cytochrome d ubiquinol oxidase subunit I
VTEIGRQPFMIFGLLRVRDVASSVPAASIGLTLVIYLALYSALLLAYVLVVKHMAEKAALPAPPPTLTLTLRGSTA